MARRKGFTLLEVVVSTLLLGICIVLIAQLLRENVRAYRQYRSEAMMKQRTDSALDQITSEVRTAYEIKQADSTSIIFKRYFSDGKAYEVTYSFVQNPSDPSQSSLQRSWRQIGKEDEIYGHDFIAANITQLDLSFVKDLDNSKNTEEATVQAQITSKITDGKGNTVMEYNTATESKRRVVKQADSVSVTVENPD